MRPAQRGGPPKISLSSHPDLQHLDPSFLQLLFPPNLPDDLLPLLLTNGFLSINHRPFGELAILIRAALIALCTRSCRPEEFEYRQGLCAPLSSLRPPLRGPLPRVFLISKAPLTPAGPAGASLLSDPLSKQFLQLNHSRNPFASLRDTRERGSRCPETT